MNLRTIPGGIPGQQTGVTMIGQFWDPETPEDKKPGALVRNVNGVHELSTPIVFLSGNTIFGATDAHGTVTIKVRNDAEVISYPDGFPYDCGAPYGSRYSSKFSADMLLIGAHQEVSLPNIARVSVQIDGLNQWIASQPSIKNDKDEGLNEKFRLDHELLGEISITRPYHTQCFCGCNSLQPEASIAWVPRDSMSVDAIYTEFIKPLQVFLSIMMQRAVDVHQIKVETDIGEALDIELHGMRAADQQNEMDQPLISFSESGMPVLLEWLMRFKELGYSTIVLHDSYKDAVQVETSALLLSAASEGLHKRLHPGEDLSYCKRLESLFETVPAMLQLDLSGKTWAARVSEFRNDQAHGQFDFNDTDGSQDKPSFIRDTLSFVLSIRLLVEVGVLPDALCRHIPKTAIWQRVDLHSLNSKSWINSSHNTHRGV